MLDRSLETFRQECRVWLEENCPVSMRKPPARNEVDGQVKNEAMNGGGQNHSENPESYVWLERMSERGWTVPTWPKEYGGAGLDHAELKVLLEEMRRIKARAPLGGMGVSMIGPTLLEYGTDEQKARHLPRIASGEISWCQGYSEPGAGSDLASLQTKAEDCGDHYLINGSKIWTSGADSADWIFCLVRTDPDVPKHEGISFMLFSMRSDGVTTKPINLINGRSPFCQTFFDDVEVPKHDLVHEVNRGWTVAKRLLQHERLGLAQLLGGGETGSLRVIKPGKSLAEMAREYTANGPGRLKDHDLRDAIATNEMSRKVYGYTQQRAIQEAGANTPGAATSTFSYIEAEVVKEQLELQLRIRGFQAFGWEGDDYTEEELRMCRLWLEAKSMSIAGGSNEVQLNIIAKRVLGLPD